MSKAVLLVNLGSPDSPSVPDVRRYLNEFLMDGRVIDSPWPLRRLHRRHDPDQPPEGIRRTPTKIWTKEGSPLVVTSQHVQAALQKRVTVPVELAMRYQNPSIESAVEELAAQGRDETCCSSRCFRITRCRATKPRWCGCRRWRRKLAPQMKITVQPPYYDAPDYIAALVASAADYLEAGLRSPAVQLSRHSGAASAQVRSDRLPLPAKPRTAARSPARPMRRVIARNVSKRRRRSSKRPACRKRNIPCPSNPGWAETRG